jgi:hypothetical protein
MLTELQIKLADVNDKIESLRRNEIEKRIAARYTKSQEFRLYVDRESDPEAWQEHEEFVNQIKEQVDAEIAVVLTTKQ